MDANTCLCKRSCSLKEGTFSQAVEFIKGNKYEIIKTNLGYRIINEKGIKTFAGNSLFKMYFMDVSEYRTNQLNQILTEDV